MALSYPGHGDMRGHYSRPDAMNGAYGQLVPSTSPEDTEDSNENTKGGSGENIRIPMEIRRG